ncbi:MAG: hypothetical protein KDA47_18410, partial [Planctomycetales bacterium]|nr:hypothetical protein [Planctomycetales bacterium]
MRFTSEVVSGQERPHSQSCASAIASGVAKASVIITDRAARYNEMQRILCDRANEAPAEFMQLGERGSCRVRALGAGLP